MTVGWDEWSLSLLKAYDQIPRAMACFSLLGSCWIVVEVLTNAQKRVHIQKRLLVGMSATDIITSITYIWGVSAFPSEMPSGLGNTTTCDVQGFLGQFTPSTAFYNFALAFYYLAMIQYKWSQRELKRIENYCHVIALVFPVVTGAICVHLKVFNPAYIHCWIYEYPYGCLHSDEIDCIRGGNESVVVGLGWGLYYAPVLISLAFGSIAMFKVYRGVKAQFETSQKYRMPASNQVPDEDPDTVNTTSSRKKPAPTKEECVMTKQVATQGLCYFGAFVVTWFFPFVTTILENTGIDNIPVLFGLAISLPLQGFMNWLVYIRPRALDYFAKRKTTRKPKASPDDTSETRAPVTTQSKETRMVNAV